MLKHGLAGMAAVAALAAACGSAPVAYSEPVYTRAPAYSNVAYTDYGRVVAIDVVREGGERHGTSGAGAVIGGIAGGVIGHQFGSGRGNTAATVAGAAGGALAGNEVEKRRGSNDEGDLYRVTVRFEDGRESSFTQPSLDGIRVGDRVRIDRDRVVRD